MDHRLPDLERLKGAHLDNLIRVALRYEKALELQAFLNSDDRTPSDAERAACQRAYALFEQKLREKETADRRALRRRAWKKKAAALRRNRGLHRAGDGHSDAHRRRKHRNAPRKGAAPPDSNGGYPR